MRFFSFLAAAALPITIFSMPAAPLDIATIETRELGIFPKRESLPILDLHDNPAFQRLAADKVKLARRQDNTSLCCFLSGILPALQAAGTLLNAQTINNIRTNFDGLATVLGND
ncbi:hypothetical protein EK21DRAFT_84045 [Setomelanomma holmii]|uniref:Uncharacterized protein n=1 Tax=Setomelanomma holmii TaxID=210430 RepID=A0A9P4HNT4_9PLEO|nr:hypothetical protein EK21DRAFT_84045 [Setomelanomma holmii]